ncbi:tryptophan synthase subunit alpha [Falsarthrobacter nasiphocae]|uniref:Tryptophan synthase alpha chain n=1 Tax=Falsarthrobacter nasiphocae TaxID=189863 RepID=A0AAE3YDL1_9MICC|nr:tryptophan synthase subunit alpha [Falsarthrobacter nasiphocae]MDR6891225.1 tryptophan synthase alpha chain [Falsarthrobacter nasiphocae]
MSPTVVTAAEKIDAAREEGRAALIGYLPAGFPDVEGSIEAGLALAKGGADIIEIGVPYSDPVMDGPVIQDATTAALAGGFRVRQVFDVVRGIREGSDAAVLVMTYWNPVLQVGIREFGEQLKAAGGSGLITPDLVPDEAAEWIAVSDELDLERVFLVAPSSTDARMRMTVEATRGFVYGVSTMGVTGARESVSEAARRVVERAHEAGAERVCVGIGVSTPEHVREIAEYAEGAIVGTAIVAALAKEGPDAVGRLAARLTEGARRA